MTTSAIRFEGVSKAYPRARMYGALRDELMAGFNRVVPGRRAPAPDVVRALEDVSFELEQGSSVAIVGLNGAGKTTALKIICRITYPTGGVVQVRGRVGALIEVGSGMHPELTGRENIQLYGRILGLRGRDIARRFGEIVDFAGIGAAIDQPVKQYSSGMQLRLGFSVAAHLEPDVFLVDEAIAVGDAGFQHRCVERMGELVREGRTLVFVSHDMSAIETLCDRAIFLRQGRVALDGPAREVVRDYLLSVQKEQLAGQTTGRIAGEKLAIQRVSVHDADGNDVDEVATDGPMTVRLHYHAEEPIAKPIFSIGLTEGNWKPFVLASMLVDGSAPERIEGEGHIDCTFDTLPLQPRVYDIWGEVIGESGYGEIVDWQRFRRFRVLGDIASEGKSAVTHSLTDAPVRLPYNWHVA